MGAYPFRKRLASAGLAISLLVCVGAVSSASGPPTSRGTEAEKAGTEASRFALIAAANRMMLWSDMVVPFEFDATVSSHKRRHFNEGMRWWKAVGFVFVPYDKNKHHEWIQFSGDGGSSCAVGRQGLNQPTVCSIGYFAGDGNAAHEIGHALGLKHEHTRHAPQDRDAYITLNWDAIIDDKEYNYLKLGTSWKSGCSPVGPQCVQGTPVAAYEFGAYDYDSIMHYGSHDFGEVTFGTVFTGGLICLLKTLSIIGFDPECFTKVPYTKEVFRRTAVRGGGKVYANRGHLSAIDVAEMKTLYHKYAFDCGAMGKPVKVPLAAPSGIVSRNNATGCRGEEFGRTQYDYTDLEVTVTATSRTDLPVSDFRLKLITPAPGGGSRVLTAVNTPGNSNEQTLKNTVALLPGRHTLVFENLTTTFVDYKMTYTFTGATVPKDTFDLLNQGNSISAPVDLGALSAQPLLGSMDVGNLTMHTNDDIDYFTVTLPSPGNYEPVCGQSGAKGPGGRPIVPSSLKIRVTRQDNPPGIPTKDRRKIRTVIYKYDRSGNLIGDASHANGARPWGWEMLGLSVECPHKAFGSKPVVFSFQDCSAGVDSAGGCKPAKRHFYSFYVSYSGAYEWRDPTLLQSLKDRLENDLQVLPEPGPRGQLSGRQMEWFANQGSLMIDLLNHHMGNEGEALEAMAGRGVFIQPGALNRVYRILAEYGGDPEALDDPQQLLTYIVREAEALRIAEQGYLERLNAGDPELFAAGAVVDDVAEAAGAVREVGVSDVEITEGEYRWAPLDYTLYGEKAASVGEGEPGTAYFQIADQRVPMFLRLINGVAVTQGDMVINLDAAIREQTPER